LRFREQRGPKVHLVAIAGTPYNPARNLRRNSQDDFSFRKRERIRMAAHTLGGIEARSFQLRGLVGGLLFVAGGIALALSSPAISFGELTRTALTAAGWSTFVVGLAWRFWATLYVGGRKVGGHHEPTLTTVGPYSVVRNPLYVGSFCIGLSCVLLSGSATLLFVLLFVTAHYVYFTIPAEERFLRRTVGNIAYDVYAVRTPRYLPKWSNYATPTDATFTAKSLRKEARRAVPLLLAPLVLTLLAAARCQPWWSGWFTLP
jgi:protein-S-isoprenylcysteine O-methyltransferase Ste14